MNKPLAFKMRPSNLNDCIGQDYIKDFLNNLIANDTLVSMIFYGKPGSGKTTIAKAFANTFKAYSISLNAVSNNKADMEKAFLEAIRFQPSIVIIDEIHRLDKAKQDLLLPHLENGDFYLIGCTTANPLISLNPAIRSRCRLLETKSLSQAEIKSGLLRAIKSPDGLNNTREFKDEALDYLAKISSGDLRFAYNQLECLALSFNKSHVITLEDAKEIASAPNYFSDLDEDNHYDTVSAMQKSIRGSEVDAALYYLAKLIKSGDLDGIIRRLEVTAYEDIGLANPQAVDRCKQACDVAKDVGFPEACIPLAFSVCELALSPKSRSASNAIEEALNMIDDKPCDVKDYLKLTRANVNELDSYPYDMPWVWKYIEYLPDEMKDVVFYHASNTGKYERNLNEYQNLNKNERYSNMRDAKKYAKK